MESSQWTRRRFTTSALLGSLGSLGSTAATRTSWALTGNDQDPRILLTPARLEQAKRWRTGHLSEAWRRLQGHCDRLVKDGRPSYRGPTPHDGEMLWQREAGNSLPTLALGYLLSGNHKYKDLSFAVARDACGYDWWGGPTEAKQGLDLSAGHLLFGMGLLLDWLGPEMDASTREIVTSTLKQRGAYMVKGADGAYWSRTLLQNHLWVCMTGLLAAGIALQRYDVKAAHPLIATAAQKMQPCFALLPPDGSDQEGPGYWTYGAEYLLKYQHMATELLNLPIESEWFRRTQNFCIAFTLPLESAGAQRSIFNFADAMERPYYGPEYLLRRLAALNHDSAAQEMANRLEVAGAVASEADWLNFVWYDDRIPASGLSNLPTQQYFDDMDLVVSRSDRSGHESVVVMRAGPPLGKKVQKMHIPYDVGTAHTHPDVNHITLFGGGEMLLMDNGYAAIKETSQHNTLVINGQGQVGSGKTWTKWPSYPVPDPQPALKAVSTTPTYDYWVGEGATAYPATYGLRRFDRHVLFLKSGGIVVVDDLDAEPKAELQLLWHPGAEPTELRPRELYQAVVGKASLRAQFHLPPDAQVTLGRRTYSTHGSNEASLAEIAVHIPGGSSMPVTVFAWGRPDADPQVVWKDGHLLVSNGTERLLMDISSRSIRMSR